LKKYGGITFQVEQFSILHSGRTVYKESEKDTSIAFKLFRDGIRNFSFTDGLTFDELLSFLDIISRVSKEQDVALSLWESHFAHVDFYVVEEEEEILDYRMPEVDILDVDYEAKLDEIVSKEKIDVGKAITTDLESPEVEYLMKEISSNEKMAIMPLAVAILINYLQVEKSKEVIDSLIELLKRCVDNLDFYDARRIVHKLQTDFDINAIADFEDEATIMGFNKLINTAPEEIFNEFITFVGFFSRESIPYFIKSMTHVKRADRLTSLRSRIAYIAQGDPAHITVFLESKDPKILINAIAVLGLMKAEGVASLLQPLMYHPDENVRSEIISALENVGSASKITKFLDDPSSYVRIKVLQALTRMRHLRIYPEILQRIKSKVFFDLEFIEQKEYFNCLVANADKDIIRILKKIMFKWLLFGGKRYKIKRQLAAMALADIGGEEAYDILFKGLKKRNKDIRSACAKVLK
jgi:HEAT repeat protein